jgi:hypothetical protein
MVSGEGKVIAAVPLQGYPFVAGVVMGAGHRPVENAFGLLTFHDDCVHSDVFTVPRSSISCPAWMFTEPLVTLVWSK